MAEPAKKAQPAKSGPEDVREVMTNRELAKAGQEPATRTEEYSAEIVSGSEWSVETLQKLDDFEAAVNLVNETYGSLVDAQVEIGDGFHILTREQKERLVGLPMILMQWKFADSDYGDSGSFFVTVRCAVKHHDGSMGKYIFSDGGTGVAKQLYEFTHRTSRTGGIVLKKGLLRSDYTNEYGPGTTMYLDVSPDGDLPF
jgi:hypothetical protein